MSELINSKQNFPPVSDPVTTTTISSLAPSEVITASSGAPSVPDSSSLSVSAAPSVPQLSPFPVAATPVPQLPTTSAAPLLPDNPLPVEATPSLPELPPLPLNAPPVRQLPNIGTPSASDMRLNQLPETYPMSTSSSRLPGYTSSGIPSDPLPRSVSSRPYQRPRPSSYSRQLPRMPKRRLPASRSPKITRSSYEMDLQLPASYELDLPDTTPLSYDDPTDLPGVDKPAEVISAPDSSKPVVSEKIVYATDPKIVEMFQKERDVYLKDRDKYLDQAHRYYNLAKQKPQSNVTNTLLLTLVGLLILIIFFAWLTMYYLRKNDKHEENSDIINYIKWISAFIIIFLALLIAILVIERVFYS